MTYNTRSPAVKRLMKEAQELSEPTELFFAKPLEDNLFEWHFTIRGPIDTDYDGGIYHGRILLPAEYPMKPPNILLMTPSGRFEINRKICLSISGYHPETWRPSWSIRTALLAIIGFMPTHGVGAIGSLDYPPEERRKLAKGSIEFICPQCGGVKNVLKSLTEASVADVNEAKNLASQISFTGDKTGDKTVEAVQIKPIETQPIQPVVVPEPIVVTNEIEAPVIVPNIAMQPLSFEEWFYQVKCIQNPELKNGDDMSTNANGTNSVKPPVQTEVRCSEGDANGSEVATDVEEPPLTPSCSPVCLSEPAITATEPDHSADEIRQRVTSQTPVSPAPTTDHTANVDLASIRNRQSVLLKCIIFIAGILGFILAARLNNLHGEINN